MENKKIEVLVRAIIEIDRKILVCKKKNKKYYFFPGGHVKFGESAESAVTRELKEELNILIKKCSFIGVMENMYNEDNQKHHEINLVFSALVDRAKDKSLEDHIDFAFLNKKEFQKEKVLPVSLQKSVIKWLKDKKTFWESQID